MFVYRIKDKNNMEVAQGCAKTCIWLDTGQEMFFRK